MRSFDWLVIGGGIPALVSAFYLQERGVRLLVVDDNNPSASRAGAGILSPLPPWRSPLPIEMLAAAGAAAYPQLLAALGDDCGYRTVGMLVLPAAENAAFVDWHQRGGLVETVTASALLAVLPPIAALHLPMVGVLQPRRLLRVLQRQLPRCIARVEQLVVAEDFVARVQLRNGTSLEAANILLSAGAWSALLCPPPPPAIVPVRGQMLLYDRPLGVVLPFVLLHESWNFYLLQRRDGRLLAGSTLDDVGFDSRPSQQGVALLRRRAGELLPALTAATPRAAWAGLRPAAKLPIIARHPAVKNLYINSGHFRYGVTMAPAAAAHLLRVVEGTAADDIYSYLPAPLANGGSGRT